MTILAFSNVLFINKKPGSLVNVKNHCARVTIINSISSFQLLGLFADCFLLSDLVRLVISVLHSVSCIARQYSLKSFDVYCYGASVTVTKC